MKIRIEGIEHNSPQSVDVHTAEVNHNPPVEAAELHRGPVFGATEDLGALAIGQYQIPVTPEEGDGGELILSDPRTGEEVYRGNVDQDDLELAA